MKYSASHLTPFLPSFPGKITYKRILSAKNSARAPASPLSTFRMNTCESVSKQRTLSTSGMNTYAKTGGGGSHAFARLFRIRLPRIPLRASPPQRSFVFSYLQIPRRANSFFSHPYKMPGCGIRRSSWRTPGVSPYLDSKAFSVLSVSSVPSVLNSFLHPFSISI